MKKKKKKKKKKKENERFSAIVQVFNDKKNTKSNTICTVPIHVETHSA